MTDATMRRATRDDVPAIVALLADDELGRQRERPADPLPAAYTDATRFYESLGFRASHEGMKLPL
jgi:hypothetical protein